MKCPSKTRAGSAQLMAFVAGRMNGHEAYELRSHARVCETCARFVQSQSDVWDLLDSWDAPPVRMEFDRELYALVEAPTSVWERLKGVTASWIARPAMPLAIVSVLVIAGFYLERPTPLDEAPQAAGPELQAVTPTDAEQLNKAFADLQLLHQLDVVKDEAPHASKSM